MLNDLYVDVIAALVNYFVTFFTDVVLGFLMAFVAPGPSLL